jgi:hypothetical protein
MIFGTLSWANARFVIARMLPTTIAQQVEVAFIFVILRVHRFLITAFFILQIA